MTEFREDEIVDITIKGARVGPTFDTRRQAAHGGPVEPTGTVLVAILDSPSNERSIAVNLATPGVTVKRSTPDRWPPMVGDIWEDRDGRRWFVQNRNGGLRLIPVVLGEYEDPLMVELASHFLNYSGPVRLVYREEGPF